MKRIIGFSVMIMMVIAMSLTTWAASYSSAWYLDCGDWYIQGPDGNAITNAWVCDNAAGEDSQNNWYLIGADGKMITNPLIQDGSGNYYSLETAHNGNYGMLRYVNGTYDGIPLIFSQSNNGTFGAILNKNGLTALKAKYGVYNVSHISNANIYYTADYVNSSANRTSSSKTSSSSKKTSSTSSSKTTGSTSSSKSTDSSSSPKTTDSTSLTGASSPTSTSDSSTTTDKYTIYYYVNGSKWKTKTSDSCDMEIINYGSDLEYWQEHSTGAIYFPYDCYSFGKLSKTTRMDAVLEGTSSTALQYKLVCRKAGSVYNTLTSENGEFIVPSCSNYNNREFLYWTDQYDNNWEPGDIFSTNVTTEYLDAVFDSESTTDE